MSDPSKPDPDAVSRGLAHKSLETNDPTGWFEALYRAVEAGETNLPWDRATANGLLVEWAETKALKGLGRSAVVVGFGTGLDAEFIADLNFVTTAFEVSPTAVEAVRRRHQQSSVHYVTADLLSLPQDWHHGFELVVECLTVQALPRHLRCQAIHGLRSLVAPGGTLIVIATAVFDSADMEAGPPWPLTEADMGSIAGDGITVESIEHFPIDGEPEFGRWRAIFRRG